MVFVPLALMIACGQQDQVEQAPCSEVKTPPADAPLKDKLEPESKPKGDEMLLLDGTPKIPAALKERLGQYLNTRGAWFGDISGDGTQMLVSTRFAETNQLHLIKGELQARNQLTFLEEPVSASSFVPGSNAEMVYLGDVGGNEQYQLFRLNITTGKTTAFTKKGARVRQYAWSRDGQALAYNSNQRNGKDMDIYLCDGGTMESSRLLVETKGHWYPIDWSADGKELLLGEYISIQESRIHIVDVDTGEVTQLTPEQPVASYREARFGKLQNVIYITSDRAGEFVELYSYERETKEWSSLSADIPWNVEEMALSGDGKTLAFTINEDGFRKLHFIDTLNGESTVPEEMPDGGVYGLAFARQTRVLGFTLRSSSIYADAFTYDVGLKKVSRWSKSEMGGLNSESFIAPEVVRYPTFDGRMVPAFYFRPPGDGPFPVVVWIHGGPESQARPYFYALTQYLTVELGVAVLQPNVRGSDGYGKTYLSLDNGLKREDSVKDIGSLLEWILTRSELMADRVGVYGGSYGGYMVLAALTNYPKQIVAGVEIVGISNFTTFLKNTKDYRRDLRRAEYGDERDPQILEFFQKISPTQNVEKIQSALFVAQGANDPRVPATEAEQIVKAVRGQGRDVWYMLARNEGHGFRKKKNRDIFTLLTVMFFERHLKK
jgi:dipeptidyl aminopeptidase/acylaminoacyl peptidase